MTRKKLMLSLDRRDTCPKKLWVTMWSTTLATPSSTDPLFWESHRKSWGKTHRGGFHWLCDMAIDDLGSITNLPSGETYTYIHFVSTLDSPREHVQEKKIMLYAVPSQHTASCHSFYFFNWKSQGKRQTFLFSLFYAAKSVIHMHSGHYTDTGGFHLKTVEFPQMMNVLQTCKEGTRRFSPVAEELQKIVDNFTTHAQVHFGK